MADPTLDEVDEFIAEYKTLAGFLPEWSQVRGWDWSTRWGVENAVGVQQAELAFSIDYALKKPTIVMIYRKCLIYRVDIVPETECKNNDFGAMALGLPSLVCGPHVHSWCDNRGFVEQNGFGQLPFRKPAAVADTRFIRALEVIAEDLNINITPAQRQCEPPRQAALFASQH